MWAFLCGWVGSIILPINSSIYPDKITEVGGYKKITWESQVGKVSDLQGKSLSLLLLGNAHTRRLESYLETAEKKKSRTEELHTPQEKHFKYTSCYAH